MICTFVQSTLFGVKAANPILLCNHNMLMLLSDVIGCDVPCCRKKKVFDL